MAKKKYDLIVSKLKGGLPKKDANKIEDFFVILDDRIDLPAVIKNELVEHFYEAFEYYLDSGYPVTKIIKLIDPENLGDFYRNNLRQYIQLDNAAIVYPLGMRFNEMPLFRLSVNLKEDVIPSILQLALDFTIKRFPAFSAVIKTGFFWHYLETTNNIHLIEHEDDIPCKPISTILRSVRSFRVLYYKKRISIEFFHVITDGTGGMIFLKTLIGEYFRLLNRKIEYGSGVLDVNSPVDPKELVNEFENVNAADDLNTFIEKSSLQLDGKLTKISTNRVIHYQLSCSKALERAHHYKGSLTAYILAILMLAARNSISKDKGPINVQVPVNMRKFNGSTTLRNYSMYFFASKNIEDIKGLDELVPDLSKQIKEKGSEKKLSQMMATTGKLIRMVNFVPTFFKVPVIQRVYGYLGNSIMAFQLSNLGNIELPEKMKKHISFFDFMMPPGRPNRAACSMISFNNILRLSVLKATKNTSFEQEIYKILLEEGLEVVVEGSEEYES